MSRSKHEIDRRSFLATTGLTAAAIGLPQSLTAQPPASGEPQTFNPWDAGERLYRVEADIRDCVVEGTIPSDLEGAFYRVGPDPQYRMRPGNIPFDGEGHASMFRIHDGHVDYRSRFVRNERYLAQEKAHKLLFPMYRNPYLDDPAAKGLSRSTANTHIVKYSNMLLALKEDSPPTALDLNTLDTLVPNYTFDGKLPSLTFTAHPKFDPRSGNMIAFGYEAEGHGSDVISVFEVTPSGEFVWETKIRAPYVSSIHDFAVTENFVAFFLQPLLIDEAQMAAGGIHWSWDGTQPSYFGCIRRGGDGSDLNWVEGPTRGNYHVMGAFDDGDRIYVDMPLANGNQLPFMPQKDGSAWDPRAGTSFCTRVSMDLSTRRPSRYEMEILYPHTGDLPRQDDRYNTMPYRYGFQPTRDPEVANPMEAGACYARFDHQTRQVQLYNAGRMTSLAECVFAPKNAGAREGEGYLLGVATRLDQGNLPDLLILDAEHLDEGPLATVKMPVPIASQVHGWWVSEWEFPRDTGA